MYSIFTFLIVPSLAFQFGRIPLPISKSSNLSPHTYFTVIMNRHYVTPKLKDELIYISNQFEKSNPTIKTVYLDANFPFWDGFPLLPHLRNDTLIKFAFIRRYYIFQQGKKPAYRQAGVDNAAHWRGFLTP